MCVCVCICVCVCVCVVILWSFYLLVGWLLFGRMFSKQKLLENINIDKGVKEIPVVQFTADARSV